MPVLVKSLNELKIRIKNGVVLAVPLIKNTTINISYKVSLIFKYLIKTRS